MTKDNHMLSKFLIVLLLALSFTAHADMGKVRTHLFATDKITTGASDAVSPLGLNRTFQAFGNTSAGSGAASIEVQVSNDGTNWLVLDTLSLTLGTAVTHDYYENNFAWKYVRTNVASISGTNAKVSVIMGAQL